MNNLRWTLPVAAIAAIGSMLGCEHMTEGKSRSPHDFEWTETVISDSSSYQLFVSDIGKYGEITWAAARSNASPQASIWWERGQGWQVAPFHMANGGPITEFVWFDAVFGLGDQSVWFAGGQAATLAPGESPRDIGCVVSYLNGVWRKHLLPSSGLASISGRSNADIWTASTDGSIFHYDGSLWREESTDVFTRASGKWYVGVRSICADRGTGLFLLCWLQDPLTGEVNQSLLYRRTDSGWILHDSATGNTAHPVGWGNRILGRTNSGDLLSSGDGVYHWNGSSWSMLYSSASGTGRVFGADLGSIYLLTGQSAVYYDGTNWAELSRLQGYAGTLVGGCSNDREAYLIGYRLGVTQPFAFVLRGSTQ